MKRLVEHELLRWKRSSRRKPLIVRGARQVGKTWLIENFLADQFESFVKIDFEERQDLHEHFSMNLAPEGIIESLEITAGRIIPGKTLLFFDEIQACPRAVMSLRYFYEKMPELHVIAAGSLLEFAFDKISVPVGRVQYLHMHPMTFYEYLLALDQTVMAEQVLKDPAHTSVSSQRVILSELRKYFFIGGMPECVKVYRDSKSLLEVFEVQSEILNSYCDDFLKYKPQVDTSCLDAVFRHLATTVGEQIKYTKLNDAHTGPTNRQAFELLIKAKIAHKIPSSNPSGIPLGASASQKKFKACMLDIGLLQRLSQIPVDSEIMKKDLLSIYNGKMAEQFVAQELLAWSTLDLYYWSRDAKSSNAEVDFLIVTNSSILPIEVKSGKGGSLKSLHLMLEKYQNCPFGLVLYNDVCKKLPEQKLVFMPLYYVALLGKLRTG